MTNLNKLFDYYGDRECTLIANLYKKFGITVEKDPYKLDKGMVKERIEHIESEIVELKDALIRENLMDIIDALVDIVYLTKGTAISMGYAWGEHFQEVHRANSEKERGEHPKRPGRKEDLIKPKGWIPPNHKDILNRLRDK